MQKVVDPFGVALGSPTRDTLRLTGTETELLPALDRGVALWKVGQRSFIVRHRRSRAEEPLSNTDARMTAGVASRGPMP